MSKPSYLPPPPLRHHQFINFHFMEMITVGGTALGDTPGLKPVLRSVSAAPEPFSRPSLVTERQIAPLVAMSENTFSRLASTLDFTIEGSLVDSKDGLLAVTAHLMPKILQETGEMPGQYSVQQAQAYVAYKARTEFYIHWGALAELYNNSPDDQQEAIHGFFSNILGKPLREMYGVYVPPLTLPESLADHSSSYMADDGLTYQYSEYLHAWLREDSAMNQFWVEGVLPDGENTVFIGSGATLKHAIGLASVYVMNANAGGPQAKGADLFSKVIIDFNRKNIAVAAVAQPNQYRSTGLKLAWDFSSMKDPRFNSTLFMSELNDVESMIGIRWNRKSWLEDGLSL